MAGLESYYKFNTAYTIHHLNVNTKPISLERMRAHTLNGGYRVRREVARVPRQNSSRNVSISLADVDGQGGESPLAIPGILLSRLGLSFSRLYPPLLRVFIRKWSGNRNAFRSRKGTSFFFFRVYSRLLFSLLLVKCGREI